MTQVFLNAIAQAYRRDQTYDPYAYQLVQEALNHAARTFQDDEESHHVTGQQLLEGFRQHVLSEYGPMSLPLLHFWNIRRGEDVGRIVYNLIEVGFFAKTPTDSIDDFAGGYDFESAFTQPFLPLSQQPKTLLNPPE